MKMLNEIMEQERANRIELFKDIFSARLKEYERKDSYRKIKLQIN